MGHYLYLHVTKAIQQVMNYFSLNFDYTKVENLGYPFGK